MLLILSGLEIKFLNKIYKKYTKKAHYYISSEGNSFWAGTEIISTLTYKHFNVLGGFFYPYTEMTDFITGVDDVLQMDITKAQSGIVNAC